MPLNVKRESDIVTPPRNAKVSQLMNCHNTEYVSYSHNFRLSLHSFSYLNAVDDPATVLPGDVVADPDSDARVDAAVVHAQDRPGRGLVQQEEE